MNKYRSHNCNELRKKNVGNKVFLSGWINKKRDHIFVIENRYQIKIELLAEANLISPHYSIERPFDEKRNKKSF